MSSDRGAGGRFARAVRETLDAVVAPVVRDALIHDALEEAGLPEIPEDGPALKKFANGSLLAVAERALGAEFAESIADEIALRIRSGSEPPISGELPSTVRSVTPPPRSGNPPPSSRRTPTAEALSRRLTPATPSSRAPAARSDVPSWPPGVGSYIRDPRRSAVTAPALPVAEPPSATAAMLPVVLVSTEEDLLFRTFAEWFGERAELFRVRTAADVVRTLDVSGHRRCIVILDGKAPSIRPPTLAALLEDEPAVEVVLCRAAEATEHVVLSGSPGTRRWVVYREPASLDHVAAECARLVS